MKRTKIASKTLNTLKQARERFGLTQERLAQLAGTTRATIANIESGRTIPLNGTRYAIQAIVGNFSCRERRK